MSEGKIVFGGIATSSGLKAFHSDVPTLNPVIQSLLSSIDFDIDQKRSFGAAPQTKGHTIQYIVENEMAFISSATAEFPHRICFKFLQEKMKFYSDDSSVDQIRQLNSQVDQVKNIMHTNIESVLARGDSLENIMTKAEELEDKSVVFHKKSKKLKCAMIQENMKMTILLVVVIILVLLFISGVLGLIIWWIIPSSDSA